MADSNAGLTKTTNTGSSLDLDVSSLKSLSSTLKKSLDTISKKISESNKLDEKERLVMDSAFSQLNKQFGEVSTFLERYEKASKTYNTLTESQRKLVYSSLREDMDLLLRSTEKLPESLTEFSGLIKNVRGGKDFQKLLTNIEAISENVKQTADYNQKILKRNEAISAARTKLKTDVIGEDWDDGLRGLGKSALYGAIGNAAGALGPFSALLRPVGSFLKKEAPTIINALKRKKKVNSPTEAEVLKNGGNEGKAIVWQTRELKKALRKDSGSLLGDSESSFGDFLEGVKDAALALWGLKNSLLTEAGLGSALKLALKGVIIGVSVKEFVGGAKEAIDGLLSGKSAREVGEDAGEGKSFWNPLIVPRVAGSATATTLWGAGQGFSEGFKFGLDTPGILPIAAAPSFGLYGAALGGTDNFINWFDGYSDSIDLSGPFKFAENLGIPGGKAIGTWGEWVDEGYSQYGNFLQNVWEQTKSLMSWSGSKGREAGEAMSLAFNGGIPLDSTGGLSDDTLKKLQTLWFLLQFDTYDAGKRGVLLKNLTSLGVSSDLIQTGLTPEEQTSLLSDYGAMEDQMASLKQEYADLLVSSAEFERRREEVSEALGLGTEDNPVVVSLDEQSKQDIADNISKNASNNLVISGPGLNFDFSTLRV